METQKEVDSKPEQEIPELWSSVEEKIHTKRLGSNIVRWTNVKLKYLCCKDTGLGRQEAGERKKEESPHYAVSFHSDESL